MRFKIESNSKLFKPIDEYNSGLVTAILMIIALGGALAGCRGGASYNYVGVWIGHRSLNRPPDISDAAYNTARTIKLTVRMDLSCDLVDSGLPKGGRINPYSDHAEIIIDTVLGNPMSQQPKDVQDQNVPIRLTPKGPNTLELFDPKGYDSGPIQINRETAVPSKT